MVEVDFGTGTGTGIGFVGSYWVVVVVAVVP